MSRNTPNPNTTDSELDKILAEHWSDLRVVESGSPGTRSNAHRKAKRRLQALIAAKVEEAVKKERLEKLASNIRCAELEAELEPFRAFKAALQSREQDKV